MGEVKQGSHTKYLYFINACYAQQLTGGHMLDRKQHLWNNYIEDILLFVIFLNKWEILFKMQAFINVLDHIHPNQYTGCG